MKRFNVEGIWVFLQGSRVSWVFYNTIHGHFGLAWLQSFLSNMEMRALVSCSAAGNGASDRFRLSNVSPWITSARGASGSDSPATVKLGSSSMIRAFKGVSIYKNKTRRNVLSQRNKQFRPMAYLGREDLSSPDPTSFCDNGLLYYFCILFKVVFISMN